MLSLGLAAVLWLMVYNLIQPLAEWVSYELLGLARDSAS